MKRKWYIVFLSACIALVTGIGVLFVIPDTRQIVISLISMRIADPDYEALRQDGERIAEAIWSDYDERGALPTDLNGVSVNLRESSVEDWWYAPGEAGFVLHIYTGKGREMLLGEWRSLTDYEWSVVPHE